MQVRKRGGHHGLLERKAVLKEEDAFLFVFDDSSRTDEGGDGDRVMPLEQSISAGLAAKFVEPLHVG